MESLTNIPLTGKFLKKYEETNCNLSGDKQLDEIRK